MLRRSRAILLNNQSPVTVPTTKKLISEVGTVAWRIELKRSILPVLCFVLLCSAQAAWFMVRVGPLTIPDPDMHGPAAYALSTGQSFTPVTIESDANGNTVRVQNITGDSRYLYLEGRHGVMADKAVKMSLLGDVGTVEQHASERQPGKTVSVPTSTHPSRTNQYFPLIYLPQSLGLRAALWMGTSAYDGWQLSRLSNVLIFMLIWTAAIVMLPRGKLVLAIVGILPITVFMASSLMVDGTVVALCACFVALLARIIDNDRVLRCREISLLVFLSFLLVCAKIVYAPIVLVLLAIPGTMFSIKRKCISAGIWVLMLLMIFLPWYFTYSGTLAVVNITDNIDFIFAHPMRSMSMIVGTLLRLPIRLPSVTMLQVLMVMIVWVVSLMKFARINKRHTHGIISWVDNNRYGCAAALSIGISLLLMMLFLALTWNDLASAPAFWLDGFQERYLIPLLPFAALAFIHNEAKTKTPKGDLCHSPV